MAIRERAGRKKLFLVYWRNSFTQKIQSRAVETRAEAEKLNAFVQYQLKYEREQFKPGEILPPEPEIQTLESIFYLYLRDRNFDQANLAKYLAATQAFIKKYGNTEIGKVDMQILLEMQKSCILAGNKGSTVQRKMGVMKATLHWAYQNGFIDALPRFPISPKSEPARNIPPTQDEVSRLYKVSPPHLRRVIVPGFMFGLRVGPCELMELKWSDIDLASNVIRVPNAKKGMGEPWRDVPIHPNLLPLFSRWLDEDQKSGMEYLVHHKGKPVKKIKSSWRNALKLAGITRYIRPYDLRHGFATEAIAAGADYGTVASLMGHKNPAMVLKHYQHVNSKQKVRVMENMPQLELGDESV